MKIQRTFSNKGNTIIKLDYLPYLLKITILAGLYVGAAKVGLLFSFVEGNVTLIWPPTGLALAALLIFGYRLWPGIALGAFLATASTGVPGFVLIATIGNTLGAVAGVYLLRRVGFNQDLARVQDVANLIFWGAGLSSILSTTIDVAGLCLTGLASWPAYGAIWWFWWLGDAMGVLLVTPALLTWIMRPNPVDNWSSRQWLEAGATLLTGLAISLLIFGNRFPDNRAHLVFIYLLFPPLLWAALRFGPTGAATMNLIINAMTVVSTVRGYGPFAGITLAESLYLWASMGIALITTLVTAAVTAERKQAQEALQASQDQLAGVIASAMDAIITVNETQHIVFFNAAAEQMFGYSAPDLIGQSHERLLPERFRTAHRQHIHRFGQTGVTNRNMSDLGVLWALRADGQEFQLRHMSDTTICRGVGHIKVGPFVKTLLRRMR